MNNALRTCGSIIAGFFAFLFVIVTVIVLLIFNLEWRLFNANTLSRALEGQGLYERLPALVAEQLTISMTHDPCLEDPAQCGGDEQGPPEEGEGGPALFLRNLSQENWEQLLSTLLPPGWLEAQVQGALDSLFAFLNAETETLSVTFSLVELKEGLVGQAGIDAVLELMSTLPPCDPELLASEEAMREAFEGGGNLMVCNPPEEMLPMILPELENTLSQVVADIPDETDMAQGLLGLMGGGEEGEAVAEGPGSILRPAGFMDCVGLGAQAISSDRSEIDRFQVFQCARLALRMSPLVPLGLLLLIALFAVRSLKGWLVWWGAPLMIVGLIGVGIWLVSLPTVNWLIARFITIESQPISAELMSIAQGVLRSIMRSVFQYIGIESGAMALIGSAMLGGSFFVKSRRRRREVESQPLPGEPPQVG